MNGFLLIDPSQADTLGRLFTSISERKQLEKIRHIKDDETKKVEVVEVPEPIVKEKEVVVRNEINLRGLVYRSDGKNTAWINESNTFEGDLESQYIQIPNNKIKSDQVTIIMPDDSTNVDLRVGEAFTPEPLEREVIRAIDIDDDT